MLKRINIKSLLQAKDSLNEACFKDFLKHYDIKIRNAEIEDLRCLTNILCAVESSICVFDSHYIGYTIPQIGKEFDILHFSQEYIVNIELKSTCAEEKIAKQLIKNKYYLSFLGRKIFAFTFVSDSKKLYALQDDGDLEETQINILVELLANQKVDGPEDLDSLFNPSDYLVSPFNSTTEFLAGKYFLTLQQQTVKNQIKEFLEMPKAARFFSIIGGAGTGKTLLTYDIAKSFFKGKTYPLIIHCGNLNDGHSKLIIGGWTIVAIKNYAEHDFYNFNLVIVDEAQRIRQDQLEAIIEKVKLVKCGCIFSHDGRQTLAEWEATTEVSAKIGAITSIKQFKLSEKIRTNKEIAVFIKLLFKSKILGSVSSKENIEINYFKVMDDAKSYLDSLEGSNWEVLRFTPSQYNREHHNTYSEISRKTSHQVIGQEFDNVVVAIDQYFFYDVNGDLSYKGMSYYDAARMLFQNISRCRKKLNLVLINNDELLSRCISILQ